MHPDQDPTALDDAADALPAGWGGVLRSELAIRVRTLGGFVLDAAPIVAAVLLLGGVVVSAVLLFGVGHPDLGWSDLVVLDAKAWSAGHLPYGDPAAGYVGLLYTPLFTGVVALLLGVKWWEGWGPFVSLVSVGVSLLLVARFVVLGVVVRWARFAPAAAVVAFPLAAFTIFPTNGVFEARPDQLAWCLLIAAALRVLSDSRDPGPDADPLDARSLRGRVVTGVLLAASVLAKQTTLIPAIVVVVAAAGIPFLSARSNTDRERWAARLPIEALVAGALGAITLLVLQIASDGFAYDLMFGLARRHGRWRTVRQVLESDLDLLAVPIAITIAGLVAATAPLVLRRSGGNRFRRCTPLLVALAIGAATVPGAVLAQAKQGGDTNQLAGPVWGATLVLAAALMLSDARARRNTARVVGVLLVVSAAGFVTTRLESRSLGAPDLVLDHAWREVPDDLVAANDLNQLVLDYEYPSYSITPENSDTPGEHIAPDLTAGGYTPRAFVRALLDGKYDRVRLFPQVFDGYAAGYGQHDESFFWKINEIIRTGYDRAGSVRVSASQPGVTFYAPGPRLSDLAWMARCFGPYRGGGLDLEVRAGGGRWCATGGDLLLDAGPSDTSELVLRATARSGFDVAFGADAASATLTASGGASALVSTDGQTTTVLCPSGTLRSSSFVVVRLDPGRSDLSCSESGGTVTVRVGADGDATLVATVAGLPRLARFTSSGERVRVVLHDPTPGDFG